MQKIKVGILGATGCVGQRFIQLLDNHPFFVVVQLGASLNSAGKKYMDACKHWKMETDIPKQISELEVVPCEPSHFMDCSIIFSALDSSVAHEIGSTTINQ